jgi:drug/metabolite transporter (DMT)-like permease
MVFLFVLAVMYAGEKVHRAHLFSALLIAIGIIVIVFEGFSQTGISLAMGDALILSASFVTAVGSFMFRQFLHGVPPQIVLLTRNMMGMGFFFVLSPFVPTTLYAEISVFPFALIGTLLGFCFIAQFLNIFSFYQAIDRLPISHVSLCVSLEIIGSAAFAHWYLKEAFYGYHFVGGALIFSGIIVLEVMSSRWSLRHKESQLVQERVNIA